MEQIRIELRLQTLYALQKFLKLLRLKIRKIIFLIGGN